MARGQSALEFVVLSSVALVGLSGLIFVAESVLIDVVIDSNEQVVESIVLSLRREFVLAEEQPEGYRRTFNLPVAIDGFDYRITVLEEPGYAKDALLVSYKNQSSFLLYVDQNISGTLKPGANSIYRAPTVLVLN